MMQRLWLAREEVEHEARRAWVGEDSVLRVVTFRRFDSVEEERGEGGAESHVLTIELSRVKEEVCGTLPFAHFHASFIITTYI